MTSHLIKPVISEKAAQLATLGKYVFEVAVAANNPEIKKEIERVYKVKVAFVNTITTPGTLRRRGPRLVRSAKVKKAVVTLVPGQTIEGLAESA